MADEKQLWRICEDALAAVGYDLVELEYLRDQQGWVLRIFIDHLMQHGESQEDQEGQEGGAAQGITHKDCASASRHLSTVLDVEDPIAPAYRLEVSSPGVRRPVRKRRDFERFVGRSLRVQLLEPLEGRRNFVGRLTAVSGETITVETDEGRAVALPLAQMRRARLEEELAG